MPLNISIPVLCLKQRSMLCCLKGFKQESHFCEIDASASYTNAHQTGATWWAFTIIQRFVTYYPILWANEWLVILDFLGYAWRIFETTNLLKTINIYRRLSVTFEFDTHCGTYWFIFLSFLFIWKLFTTIKVIEA